MHGYHHFLSVSFLLQSVYSLCTSWFRPPSFQSFIPRLDRLLLGQSVPSNDIYTSESWYFEDDTLACPILRTNCTPSQHSGGQHRSLPEHTEPSTTRQLIDPRRYGRQGVEPAIPTPTCRVTFSLHLDREINSMLIKIVLDPFSNLF